MVNIKGSTVVVTGGQRGLGKAIVDEFLRRGAAKVYATEAQRRPARRQRRARRHEGGFGCSAGC
jgi:NAD(P)-dependent dehydrogenase (short-subunit alcohol dehydrogenase family)